VVCKASTTTYCPKWLTFVSVGYMNQKPVIPVLKMGDRLRVVRREYLHRISQTEMAKLLGVPRERYAAWESGNSEPRPADGRAIANLIESRVGVSAAWVLGVHETTGPGPIPEGSAAQWPVSKVTYLSDYAGAA
jgi:transcriptional regulator with XRE-family HTH domain